MKRSLILIVAALLSFAIPAVRPATIQSNTKQAPHKSILTQDPKDLPPDCQAVHKRSLNLLQEFDAALPVKDKELAIKSVEYGRKLGRTLPQAYEYVGAGAALTEHYPVAAWASLNAARLSWRAESVTNVGVYLFYLNRFDDAEAFLNCARRMAPQSPFPLEALAMIAFKRKTYPLAMSLIEQAVRLMPNDTNVLYTAGIIHYKAGQIAKGRSYLWKAQQRRPGDKTFEEAAKAADPRGENRPPLPKDALAKLIQTTFASFDETLRKGEALAAYANRIERLKRSLNPPTYTADKLNVGVIRAKVRIEESERRFRELKPPLLQRLGPSLWNQAVFDCISAYFDVFRAFQFIADNADPSAHLLANAMDVPADRLVEDLYVAKELPTGVFYLMLRQERLHEFARTYTEAWEEYRRVRDECDNVDADECAKLANRTTWCPKVPPRFSVMAPIVDENINAAAGGLKGAVQLELLYTRAVVGEASDFVSAAVSICRPIPTGQREDPANVLTPQTVDKHSRQLFKAYIGGFVELKSAFIETSYNDFQQDIDSLDNDIDALREEIKQRCQEPEGIEKPIIDKEIEALIAALKESSEFGAGLMFECEIEVKPYKLSLKMPDEGILPVVGLERDIGGFGVKVEGQPGSDRRGVEVNVGGSAAAGGVAGDVSVKLWGEYGREGLTDYGAEIEGKLGVGVKEGDVGLACYLGNANARINARVFAESYARAMRN